MNVAKIKGTHTSMKSGMVAAETAFEALAGGGELAAYPDNLKKTWLWPELRKVRNIRRRSAGDVGGLAYSAFDTFVFFGRAPWTFHHHEDHKALKPARECKKIEYPKPDGKLTFDRLSSVFLANVSHEENQPCHLTLKDASVPVAVNLAEYDGPEQRYCPAQSTSLSSRMARSGCRSISRTASTAKPATSRTHPEYRLGGAGGAGGPNYPNM